MSWFLYSDMHSGGGRKLCCEYVVVEAESEAVASARFEAATGRDPDHVTCECCGADYSHWGTSHDTVSDALLGYRGFAGNRAVLVIHSDGHLSGAEVAP